MVKVVAEKYIDENKLEAFMALAGEMIELTRKEDGCLEYNIFQDENDPRHFSYIESWETREHLEKHFESEHFKRLVPKLGDLSEAGPVVIYKEV
ncbi:antibiotic biosynthesis monooxygenase [Acidaminobacter sp. JC074]|uniref:putative quinol monooxygenase n=1 Tax=Acidaminobacter sp. JC074 TaxID=2530199 RepID=UPI001F106939|nr:putative quinol monooxygenase [Acidaminobacter sp. JC074]MCH4891264.1 antibiotic biosynthesis monooxygenase [Acidaminobacter sp. JC074]